MTTIPLPVGATSVGEWDVDQDSITRVFYGKERGFGLRMSGVQDHTGRVLSSGLSLGADHFEEISGPWVREYIADCQAIADELDALAGPSGVVIELPASNPRGVCRPLR
jgi:hypothetical protein